MSNLHNLACEIINSNSPAAYEQMQAILNDVSSLTTVFSECSMSDSLIFVTCEMLAKLILNKSFNIINQTKSEDSSRQDRTAEQNQKVNIYVNIVEQVLRLIMNDFTSVPRPPFAVKSGLNLISLCIKAAFQCMTVSFNSKVLDILLPSCSLNWEIIQNTINVNTPFLVQPLVKPLPRNFLDVSKILVSAMDYVTTTGYDSNYYDFRKNVYNFRNFCLPQVLFISIQCFKRGFNDDGGNISENVRACVALLQSVIVYPYTLNLHQFESSEQPSNLASHDVYFPGTFRCMLLSDIELITALLKLFNNITVVYNPASSSDRDFRINIVKILGTISGASTYSFQTDNERFLVRSNSLTVVTNFLSAFSIESCRSDPYYIELLYNILIRVLSLYQEADYQGNMKKFLDTVLVFCSKIILGYIPKTSDEGKNPFNLAFGLIEKCLDVTNETPLSETFKYGWLSLFNLSLERFIDLEWATNMYAQFNENKLGEIEFFEDTFENFVKLTIVSQQNVINRLSAIVERQQSQESLNVILHFVAQLLSVKKVAQKMTPFLHRFFQMANLSNSLAGLHLIDSLVDFITEDIVSDYPTTQAWLQLSSHLGLSFHDFILSIIKLCLRHFCTKRVYNIDMCTHILLNIYTKLKGLKASEAEPYYQLMKQLMTSLGQTAFVFPEFLKQRSKLFGVISVIWVNNSNFNYVYEIYEMVSKDVKVNLNKATLTFYISDVTGLLTPLEHNVGFRTLTQLIINDVNTLFNSFGLAETRALMEQPEFMKTFCCLAQALTQNNFRRLSTDTHSNLPLAIYDFLAPKISIILELDPPQKIIRILDKLLMLNPIQPLIAFPLSLKGGSDFNELVRSYFDNIHRVPDLQTLYPLIQNNVDYMREWWQQAIIRNLLPQPSMIHKAVQAKIWKSARQKETLAKLLYRIGGYNAQYVNVVGFNTEREFVDDFNRKYV